MDFLEGFIEGGKPPYPGKDGYHFLLQSPFRYSLPVDAKYAARFKPPLFDRNVFYGSINSLTACFECAYHFMRVRLHLINYEMGPVSRTCFSVQFEDPFCIDLREIDVGEKILSHTDYTPSHDFSWTYLSRQAGLKYNSVLYTSVRHIKGENIATFELLTLAKNPDRLTEDLTFIFDKERKVCLITNNYSGDQMEIKWIWH
jgi:hypothetical protein